MAKTAKEYLIIHPWEIIEENYHPDQSSVSESIFSLGNEYMGVRGYFEENYSGIKFLGSFFNGVYEHEKIGHPQLFKGFVTEGQFLVNSVDWLYTEIECNGEKLDLARSKTENFTRKLDMYRGILTRTFTWILQNGKKIRVSFERFLSMENPKLAGQKITFSSLDFSGNIYVTLGLDFNTVHQAHNKNFWNDIHKEEKGDTCLLLGETIETKHKVCSAFRIFAKKPGKTNTLLSEKNIRKKTEIQIISGEEAFLEKIVINQVDKKNQHSYDALLAKTVESISAINESSYNREREEHIINWRKIWEKADIRIVGDPKNQQGIRFCIFHLYQSYHGVDPSLNISAKGLTGEAYCGWTWWDTETYCLPFYLFTNSNVARNLLDYRYHTLPQAQERAKEKDCRGARYPMGTINGRESVGTWQHGDLEIHVSVAVAYGIWHYIKVTEDRQFLYSRGVEMLVEICRYYSSRGQWAQKTDDFGFWGVMGPDEFAMMVHNNCYTNVMVKKAFLYTLQVIDEMRKTSREELKQLEQKCEITNDEYTDWQLKAEKMRVPYDSATQIYEQYDGYFNLPHIDPACIRDEEFPLYKNWAYYRIFRNDMIKQPDVLLLHLFYSQDYSLENKRANFNFYEPRCCHESSLSPSIHSILANELGMHEKAYVYAEHSTRLDLDNYNNNTSEGIHNTSMAAAWMNIVYGFAGMRSDGDLLIFKPTIPKCWKEYSFKISYRGSRVQISINKSHSIFKILEGESLHIKINDSVIKVQKEEIKLELVPEI